MKIQNTIRGQTEKSQHKIVLKTGKEMGTSYHKWVTNPDPGNVNYKAQTVELWRLNVAARIHCLHKAQLNATESILGINYAKAIR